ncbi:MAG: fumarylacetoacetase [Burkholderiales bacterium]|nr:fumarylacetoacetase [Burkholderiales bacterium]
MIDATHDPALQSWVDTANAEGCDFPIQNLPFGRYRVAHGAPWRIGVAIGDAVLDLGHTGLAAGDDMRALLGLDPAARRALRLALSEGLRQGSARRADWAGGLHACSAVELGLPCEIGDYTDFYVGIHHATAVGKLFRPDNPLLPNYKWVPIGYHGRASTINASGHAFHRPLGQIKGADDAEPRLAPTQRLDYELELGLVVGRGNAQGRPIPIAEAEDHLFGMTLFNDWSARDFQAWEYQPLGPFLSKNFASTVSPWIVTMEALAPFRRAFERPAGDPRPLPYLDTEANRAQGAIDVGLEIWLQTAEMRRHGMPAQRIAQSNFADAAYWTPAQLVTHHSVNGCALHAGDLLGTGTLSGPRPEQAGSLLELSQGGKVPINLASGERRTFLADGDEVTLRGHCERAGARRIGFGACSARILPPHS